ncbi:MAG: DUF1559 domain-containing protein [Pirellulales bacterium]|nr:DUF1559 domain-containing protein [Pirellulales bacterium]
MNISIEWTRGGSERATLLPRGARPSSPNAFSLIELLVVIAILGVLVALLLPAVQSARETARRLECSNHLHQIGLAILAYENATQCFPPSHSRDPDHGVLALVLPYIEQNTVHDLYDFKYHWDARENRAARETDMPLFVCPSAPSGRPFISDYGACLSIMERAYRPLIDSGAITPRQRWNAIIQDITEPTRVTDVLDGLSQSFLFFEDGGRPLRYVGNQLQPGEQTGALWADHRGYFCVHALCNGTQMTNCNNLNEIYSFHPGGCNYAYGDGSIRYHPESIDPEVFVSLFTMDAGDIVSL